MTALAVALGALEEIAARGIVVRTSPPAAERDASNKWWFRCSVCNHVQGSQGACANRECLTAIARRGIDETRRAP